MTYQYLAFGFPVESSFELPALSKWEGASKPTGRVIKIFEKIVPDKIVGKPLIQNQFGENNELESIFTIEGIAKFYVHNGDIIEVQPLCNNRDDINQQIYANCLTIALLQQDIILLHCSGIFINENEVLLFAAPKFTGKSTLSVMLQQKGYLPFTDDTAVITFENDRCYAQASYPSLRLWEESISQQEIYNTADKNAITRGADGKSAFYFHQKFPNTRALVSGIVFLECKGDKLSIERLKPKDSLQLVLNNIYRRQWLWNMKKQRLEFDFISNITNKVALWKAVRPVSALTYKEFPQLIEENTIHKLLKK
jgi:hypothetical protein